MSRPSATQDTTGEFNVLRHFCRSLTSFLKSVYLLLAFPGFKPLVLMRSFRSGGSMNRSAKLMMVASVALSITFACSSLAYADSEAGSMSATQSSSQSGSQASNQSATQASKQSSTEAASQARSTASTSNSSAATVHTVPSTITSSAVTRTTGVRPRHKRHNRIKAHNRYSYMRSVIRQAARPQ